MSWQEVVNELIREKDREFLELCGVNTSERVVPAAVKGPNVEQQAQEENVQLSTEVARES